MMEICAACKALNGQLTSQVAEPHQYLEHLATHYYGRFTMSWAKSEYRYFICELCDTMMMGDFDPVEPFAKWSIDDRDPLDII